MKKILLGSSFLILLGATIGLQAAGLNYNYADIRYNSWGGGAAGTGSGFGVAGSYGVAENINLLGSYDSGTITSGNTNILRVGAGYHMSIAERSDLYVNLFYRSDDVAAAGTNSGAEVEFGLRGKFSDKFEGDASFSSVGIGGGSNTAYKLGVAYAINDQYGITLGYANQNIYSPNLTQTYLGMRFNF